MIRRRRRTFLNGQALEDRRQDQEWVRRTGLPDGRGEVIGEGGLVHLQPFAQAGHGAGVHARHDHPPDVARLEAGGFERPGERILPERHVAVLAETLFPQFRDERSRRAPTIGELVGG